MRRYVASSTDLYTSMKTVLKEMNRLLDAMESTPSGALDEYDLGDLYEELVECVYDLTHMLGE